MNLEYSIKQCFGNLFGSLKSAKRKVDDMLNECQIDVYDIAPKVAYDACKAPLYRNV